MRKILFILAIFCLIILIPSLLICQGVTTGGELSEVETKISLLEKENIILEKKIAEVSSCEKIYDHALLNSLGSSDAETIAYTR